MCSLSDCKDIQIRQFKFVTLFVVNGWGGDETSQVYGLQTTVPLSQLGTSVSTSSLLLSPPPPPSVLPLTCILSTAAPVPLKLCMAYSF